MKMKRLSAMIQDGSFMDYKAAVTMAEYGKDKEFYYRGGMVNTRDARLEVKFVETFLDSIKDISNDNSNRDKNTVT